MLLRVYANRVDGDEATAHADVAALGGAERDGMESGQVTGRDADSDPAD
jgi:hypothetical protein